MKVEMENTTLASIYNAAGNNPRWASFDFYPEAEGETMYAFRGVTYEKLCYGTRTDSVVKAMKSKNAGLDDWLPYSRRAVKANELAKPFNELLLKHSSRTRVDFVTPHIAVMDKIFTFTPVVKFFKPYNKTFSKNEHVTFERYIEGDFQSFVGKNGAINPKMPIADILQSFSHYTYYKTDGDLVITNLKGVLDSNNFILTVPTVHSKRREYGSSDNGLLGISEFFSKHSCTEICKYFPKLNDTPLSRSSPSAPSIEYPVLPQCTHNQVPFAGNILDGSLSGIPMPPPYAEKCNNYETAMGGPGFYGCSLSGKYPDKEEFPGVHRSGHT